MADYSNHDAKKILSGVPVYFATWLKPDEYFVDQVNNVIQIGVGTDMQLFMFKLNTTKKDREFLKSNKVGL